MKTSKALETNPCRETLSSYKKKICSFTAPYSDCKEAFEDCAYLSCESNGFEHTVDAVEMVAHVFELIEDKNEEIIRDLSHIYTLIGDLYQFAGKSVESIEWFEKAIAADDRNPIPYQSIAASFIKIGNTDKAIQSLIQEISLDPTDYSSYLVLSNHYVHKGKVAEARSCIEKLLDRDAENMRGLHMLVRICELTREDSRFLTMRILSIIKHYDKKELIIRLWYLAGENQFLFKNTLAEAYQKYPTEPLFTILEQYVDTIVAKDSKNLAQGDYATKNHIVSPAILEKKKLEFSELFGVKFL